MRVFKHLHTFKPTFAFSTWLFRIAFNHGTGSLTRARLQTVSIHANKGTDESEFRPYDLPGSSPTPYELLLQTQRRKRLRQAVMALPPKYQQLVQLHYFDELTYEEIAKRQQMPVGTIKSWLHRSRAMLQHSLKREKNGI